MVQLFTGMNFLWNWPQVDQLTFLYTGWRIDGVDELTVYEKTLYLLVDEMTVYELTVYEMT